jgi:transposase InsO family protein
MACFSNATQVQSTRAATTAALPWSTQTCVGVLMALKSAAITGRRSALPLLSTAVIVKPSPMSPPLKASRAKTFKTFVITAVENRFGRINTLPKPVEWLTDNGSCFIAKDTKTLLMDIGMEPCTTPVRSPQSNGNGRMAEAFVKTFKRDYVSVDPVPDAETVIAQLPSNQPADGCLSF